MIDRIFIRNFLSHADTVLKLDPGVNAIIGPSDSGKTAIFNALNWVVNNRPSGTEFISWGTDEAEVSVDVDGQTVKRLKKGTTHNLYEIKQPRKKPTVFKGFGSAVPNEVSEILNIGDINFQFQLDEPFMFSQSPGQIARYLNQVVDLQTIDIALYNINARLRTETSQLNEAENRQAQLSEEIKEYDWLPEAEGCLAKLEAQERQIAVEKIEFKEISELIINIERLEVQIEALKLGPLGKEKQISEMLQMSDRIQSQIDEANEIARLITAIEKTENQLDECNAILNAEPDLLALIELDKKIEAESLHYNDIVAIVHNIEDVEKQLKDTQDELIKLEAKIHAGTPDICPLCDQEIPK